MKRIMSLFFACILILSTSVLAACANESGKNPETATSAVPASSDLSEETVETGPEFEFRDYGGETFTVYMRKHADISYSGKYLLVSGDGSVCDEAVEARNLQVEDKFNIQLEFIEHGNPMSTLGKDLQSGSVNYDLMLDCRNYMAPHTVSGVFADFNKMNIDFSNPWWDINCAEGFSIANRLFLMANDVSVSRFCDAFFLFFNKAIIENYHLDNPYDLESKNEWTLDKYLNLIKSVSDVHADGTLGTYGLLSAGGSANGSHMNMLTACGVALTGIGDQKQRVTIVNEQMEKINDIFDRMRDVINDKSISLKMSEASDKVPETLSNYRNYFDHARSLFADGHFLFLGGSMDDSSQFAEMQDDYGVIVNPKYNSDQDRYYHRNDPYSPIFTVPNSPSVDLERLALVTDYWAYVSMGTLIPQYYEITIKTKRVSDPTAPLMIDKVRESIMYEMADVFGIEISSTLDVAFASNAVTRAWEAFEKKIQKSLNEMNAKIAALDY